MAKRALITGITGQDGSYLAEQLLARGLEVHGIIRPESLAEAPQRLRNIHHLSGRITVHAGSVDHQATVENIIREVRPQECYHLAGASFVHYTLDDEASVLSSNFHSTEYLLMGLKAHAPSCRFYLAASSEIFGHAQTSPQNEQSSFNPRSIYGISKLAAYHLARNYRENHGIFACTGILYNHESPRRSLEFVTRKITSTVAKIHLGLADRLELGNLDAQRDWGYAPEYVDAMQRMLAQDSPDDYVIATGKLHSVREFVALAFDAVGLHPEPYLHTNPEFYRPHEAVPLTGDASKAARALGWKPQKTLPDMVSEMVEADVALLRQAA